MVDVRYHVISLVAVFLALGIGVLLGTTLVERGLIAEQKNEIKSLKETFSEIREENKELNTDLSYYSEYANLVLPYVISNRLPNMSYAKVSSTAVGDYVRNRIDSAMVEAGAIPTADITFSSLDTFEDPAVARPLSELFGMGDEPGALLDRVIVEVVTMLSTGMNLETMTRLQEIGVIQVKGNLAGPVNGVILVADTKEEEKEKEDGTLKKVDLPLISQLTMAGLATVGVEGSKVETSVLSDYKNAGISTVDHVGTTPGLTALVMVFEGRWGNYGRDKPAEWIIPEMVRP